MRLTALPSEVPLLAFVAAMPAFALGFYSGSNHDAMRLVQLAALLLTAALAVTEVAAVGVPAPRRLALWLIGALAAASVSISAIPMMALRETALMAGLAGATWIVAARLSVTSLALVRGAVLAGSTFYALLLAMAALSPLIHRMPLDWASLVVGYDNYRFFNHVETVALPLLAIAALQDLDARPGRLMRAAAWFSMTVYWAYVFCSGARGTAVALFAAGMVAAPIAGWRAMAPVLRVLAASALAGAAAYATLFVLLPAFGILPVGVSAERSLPSLASDSSRLFLWRIAENDILAAPWLGIGPMHYAHLPNPKAAHPHNIYLQVAAEWGVPMLLALLALGVRALWRLARVVRDAATSEQQQGAGLLLTCLALLLDGFVSGNFVMPVSQMWIVLALAWAMAWYRQQRPAIATASAHASAWPRVASAALLASQVWLVANVWPEAIDLQAHLAHVQQDIVRNARTSPRFWSDGWF